MGSRDIEQALPGRYKRATGQREPLRRRRALSWHHWLPRSRLAQPPPDAQEKYHQGLGGNVSGNDRACDCWTENGSAMLQSRQQGVEPRSLMRLKGLRWRPQAPRQPRQTPL